MPRILCTSLALLCSIHLAHQPTHAQAAPPPSAATFSSYAVAADHPLASAAGAQILAEGGNAVDAAVATSFALSVVRPFSCGIGGGGFMVISLPSHPKHPGKKNLIAAFNYREMAPSFASPDLFTKLAAADPTASTRGGRAAGIPGTVAGLLMALDEYGTLPRDKVMAPAIKLARDGFPVDIAYAIVASETAEKFQRLPALQQRFAFTWKRYLREGQARPGDIIKLPEQAEALELIARDGARAFYTGAIAEAIAQSCARDGALFPASPISATLSLADLKSYKVAKAEPLRFTFDGKTFLSMPPPSSGGVAMAQTLGIMQAKGFKETLKDAARAPAGNGLLPTPTFAQVLTESFKHAFADRAQWLADPAFTDVPVKRLLSDTYLRERAALINLTGTFGPDRYGTRPAGTPPVAPSRDGGTSHLCVIDSRGGAVSCTETINLEFGSWLCVEPYGFLLNNQMDDFTTDAGKPNAFGLVQSAKNAPQKGKRPLSSMTPTIVIDADSNVVAVAGASGGPRIITATTQVLLNALLLNTDARESVARPRLHHQWLPNVLEIEADYPGIHNGLAVPFWLRKFRHEVHDPAEKSAAVQLILRAPGGKLDAASDPRKGGAPAGK